MDNAKPPVAPDPTPELTPPSEGPAAPAVDGRDETIAMLTRQTGVLQGEVDQLTARVTALADQQQLVDDLRGEVATGRQKMAAVTQEANLYKAVYEQLDATFTDVKAKLSTKETP